MISSKILKNNSKGNTYFGDDIVEADDCVWAEVDRYINLFPSVKEAASAIDISQTTIWNWKRKIRRPSQASSEKMEIVSNGIISSEILNSGRGPQINNIESIREFIFSIFINPRSLILNMDPSDFYLDYIPTQMRKILDKNIIDRETIPVYMATFGRSHSYWLLLAKKINGN